MEDEPPTEEPFPDEPAALELPAREDAPPEDGAAEVPAPEEACAAEEDIPPTEDDPAELFTAEELLRLEDCATLVALELPPDDDARDDDVTAPEDTVMDADDAPDWPEDAREDGRLCALDPVLEEEPAPPEVEPPPVDDDDDDDDDVFSAGLPVVQAMADVNNSVLDHFAAALKRGRVVTVRSLLAQGQSSDGSATSSMHGGRAASGPRISAR